MSKIDLKLYYNTTYSDFTLKSSDGKEFQVHQNILAMSSTFFDKMFQGMKEKELKSVVFEDINSAILEKVLMFIYTEKTKILDYKIAFDLLYAAEKFGLDDLKLFCGNFLMEKEIIYQNAIEILAAADLHKAELLEQNCLKYIVK